MQLLNDQLMELNQVSIHLLDIQEREALSDQIRVSPYVVCECNQDLVTVVVEG